MNNPFTKRLFVIALLIASMFVHPAFGCKTNEVTLYIGTDDIEALGGNTSPITVIEGEDAWYSAECTVTNPYGYDIKWEIDYDGSGYVYWTATYYDVNGNYLEIQRPASYTFDDGTEGNYYTPSVRCCLYDSDNQTLVGDYVSNTIPDGIYVEPDALPVVSLSLSESDYCVGEEVTWVATVSSGNAPFTYQWYFDGSYDATATGSSVDKYYNCTGTKEAHVYVTDKDGDSADANSVVTIESCVSVDIKPDEPVVAVGDILGLYTEATHGSSVLPESWAWTVSGPGTAYLSQGDGSYETYSNIPDPNFIAHTKGVYTAHVNYWYGCPDAYSVGEEDITVFDITITDPNESVTTCIGTPVELGSVVDPAVSGGTYHWYITPPHDPNVTFDSDNEGNATVTIDDAGTFSVMVDFTSDNGSTATSNPPSPLITVVEVALLTAGGPQCPISWPALAGDSTKTCWSFCCGPNSDPNIVVTAASNPPMAEADLPDCWELFVNGESQGAKLRYDIDPNTPGITEVTCTAGTSSLTAEIYVVAVADLKPGSGYGLSDPNDPNSLKILASPAECLGPNVDDPNIVEYFIPQVMGGTLDILALADPNITEPNHLPDCWSLTGDPNFTVIDELHGTIDLSEAGTVDITCQCGDFTQKKIRVYIVKVASLIATPEEVCSGKSIELLATTDPDCDGRFRNKIQWGVGAGTLNPINSTVTWVMGGEKEISARIPGSTTVLSDTVTVVDISPISIDRTTLIPGYSTRGSVTIVPSTHSVTWSVEPAGGCTVGPDPEYPGDTSKVLINVDCQADPGKYTIKAYSSGVGQDGCEETKDFTVVKASISIDVAPTAVCMGANAEFSATTTPDEYEDLIEWSVDGVPSGVSNGEFTKNWDSTGTKNVTASIPCNDSKSIDIDVYKLKSISVDSSVACINHLVTFVAETDPNGYEGNVGWTGGGNPSSDTGKFFTTYWETGGNYDVTASLCGDANSINVTIVEVGDITFETETTPNKLLVGESADTNALVSGTVEEIIPNSRTIVWAIVSNGPNCSINSETGVISTSQSSEPGTITVRAADSELGDCCYKQATLDVVRVTIDISHDPNAVCPNKPVVFTATTTPANYEGLVDWNSSGNPSTLENSGTYSVSWNEAESYDVTAELYYESAVDDVDVVRVEPISSNVSVTCIGENIDFDTTTYPGGHTINWHGGDDPATGQGRDYSTHWNTSGRKTVMASFCEEGCTGCKQEVFVDIVEIVDVFAGNKKTAQTLYLAAAHYNEPDSMTYDYFYPVLALLEPNDVGTPSCFEWTPKDDEEDDDDAYISPDDAPVSSFHYKTHQNTLITAKCGPTETEWKSMHIAVEGIDLSTAGIGYKDEGTKSYNIPYNNNFDQGLPYSGDTIDGHLDCNDIDCSDDTLGANEGDVGTIALSTVLHEDDDAEIEFSFDSSSIKLYDSDGNLLRVDDPQTLDENEGIYEAEKLNTPLSVEGCSLSGTSLTATLITQDGYEASDTISIKVISLNLQAVSPAPVPNDIHEMCDKIHMRILLNENDSDGDGVIDLGDSDISIVNGDPDLATLTVNQPVCNASDIQDEEVEIQFSSEIAAYRYKNKTDPDDGLQDIFTAGSSYNIPYGDLPMTFYLEGVNASSEYLDASITAEMTLDSGLVCRDEVRYTVYGLDVDVDSDNTNGYGTPDCNSDEEVIEDQLTDPRTPEDLNILPGKYVVVNFNDSDNDGIPGFADGFNLEVEGVPLGGDYVNSSDSFTPLVIEIKGPYDPDARLSITYNASDPGEVVREIFSGDSDYTYTPDYDPMSTNSQLRLWKQTGNESRLLTDYVAPGEHLASDLGESSTITLYIEGIRANGTLSQIPGQTVITVAVDPDGDGPSGYITSDEVRLTIVDVDADIDSDNDGLDHSLFEDHYEDDDSLPGKFVYAAVDDSDNDGIPDFADGYDLFNPEPNYVSDNGSFIPLTFNIDPSIDLAGLDIAIQYSASDPANVTRTEINGEYVHTRPTGNLRLWLKDKSVFRNMASALSGGGDYVECGSYDAGLLGLTSTDLSITLYVEGINPSSSMGGDQIEFTAIFKDRNFKDVVRVTVVELDLDVDSDNNNGLATPGRTPWEDFIEDAPDRKGKKVEVNYMDEDSDGIPDYADGFDLQGLGGDYVETVGSFTPLILELEPEMLLPDAELEISYSGSDPNDVIRSGDAPYYTYTLPTGNMRIWKKNKAGTRDKAPANGDQNPGDYVVPGVYSLAQLGFSTDDGITPPVVLYIEGIRPSDSDGIDRIVVNFYPKGKGSSSALVTDAVRVTVLNEFVYEAITGVTPGSGRSIPVPGMDVYGEVLLHNRQLKVTHTNFVIPGRKLSFGVSQTYRSGHPGSGSLGKGWSGSWDQRFVYDEDEDEDYYIFHGPDGREDIFNIGPGDSLLIPSGYTCKATLVSGGIEVEYTDGSKTDYTLGSDGKTYRIASHTDRYGNAIIYNWVDDQLATVTDDLGRLYTFSYENGRIDKISDFGGLEYWYSYTGDNLSGIAMRDSGGQLLSGMVYGYDTNLITAQINGDSLFMDVYYDYSDSYQVNTVEWGNGTVEENFWPVEQYVTRHIDTDLVVCDYTFDPTDGEEMLCTESVVDPIGPYGFNLTTFYDYFDQHTTLVDPPEGPYTETVYAASEASGVYTGNYVSDDKRRYANVSSVAVIDRDDDNVSLVTNYTWKGETEYYQLESVTDSADIMTTYNYVAPLMSLTSIVTPGQAVGVSDTTAYKYYANGLLSKTLGADGGLTVYLYDTNGLLESVKQSKAGKTDEGVKYTLDTNIDQEAHIVNIIEDRDDYGRVKQATDEMGGVTNTDYDSYGRVITVTSPSLVELLQNGEAVLNSRPQTVYTYDPIRDYVGTITYNNPAANGTGTALGSFSYTTVPSVTTYNYDSLGRTTSVSVPGQEGFKVTNYAYQPDLERLAYVQNPNGSYGHVLYDSAGRVFVGVYNHDSPDLYPTSTPLPGTAYAVLTTFNDIGQVIYTYCLYGSDSYNVLLSGGTWWPEKFTDYDWAGRAKYASDEVSLRDTDRFWNSKGQLERVTTYGGNGNKIADQQYEYYLANGDLWKVTDLLTGAETTSAVNNQANTSIVTQKVTPTFNMAFTNNYDSLGDCTSGTHAGMSFTAEHAKNGGVDTIYPTFAALADKAKAPYVNLRASIGTAREHVTPELTATTSRVGSGSGISSITKDGAGVVNHNSIGQDGGLNVATEDKLDIQRPTGVVRANNDLEESIYRHDQKTKVLYDKAGRPIEKIYYNGTDVIGSELYDYDDLGRMDQIVRKDDSELNFVYYPRSDSNANNRDRLATITAGSNVLREFYNYNDLGHPTLILEYNENGFVVETWRNYSFSSGTNYGRLVGETTTIYNGATQLATYSVGYSYDRLGRRETLTYPSGVILDYWYDDDHGGVLDNITRRGDGYVIYDSTRDTNFGLPTAKSYGDGSVTVSLDYQSKYLGLVKEISVNGDAYPFVKFGYDQRGLKLNTGQWAGTAVNRTYDYDSLGRLIGAANVNGTDPFDDEYFPQDDFENRVGYAVIDGRQVDYDLDPAFNRYVTFDDPEHVGALCGAMTVPDYITADFTRVNFQADANDIVAGWLVDDGDALGLRGGGESYGWVLSGDPNDPNSNYQAVERDPNVPCSALKKTLNFMKNESLSRNYDWECAVDNGVYYVEITAGDPDGDSSDPNIYSSCRYILNAEGEEVLDGVPTSSKRWISGSATVTVTDGRLTISGDSGALHNCISYVKFLKAPTGEMPSSVDLEFAYDGRGNLLEDAHFEYAWDASDRIVEITDKSWETGDNGPQKVSYVYDAMGRRVLTRWHYESSTTQYAMTYDGVAPIEQGEILEGVVQRFYYEAGINKPALVEKYDATGLEGAYVPLTDDRGTVVGVYDVKVGNSTYGQLVEKLHYNATGLCKSFDPNGVENLTPGTDINLGRSFYDIPFGWTGMARDSFTGLYHTHFRDYDPVHGRWLSEDPAGYADGMNLYNAYMGVNGVDLLGLDYLSTHLSSGGTRTDIYYTPEGSFGRNGEKFYVGYLPKGKHTVIMKNGNIASWVDLKSKSEETFSGVKTFSDLEIAVSLRSVQQQYTAKARHWGYAATGLHYTHAGLNLGMDVAGSVPVIGEAVDVIHSAGYAGEWIAGTDSSAGINCGLTLIAVVPWADAVKYGKYVKYTDEVIEYGGKYSDEAMDAFQAFSHSGDELLENSRYLTQAGDGANVISQNKNVKEGIYEFIDTSGKPYVGQSGDIPTRLKQHINADKLSEGVNVKSTEVLGGKTAREIAEHKRIQQITGGDPARMSDAVSNIKDPIGPKRKHLLNE